MLKTHWKSLLGFFAVIIFVQGIGSSITMPEIGGWYAGLNKPSFNPPNWIFGPVWTTLYIMIAISGWLVWCKLPGSTRDKLFSRTMATYFWQLTANFAWSMLFFAMHNPAAAFADIVILLLLILLNIWRFAKVSKIAAWMLVPYLAWVSFASVLNYNIMILN